jgi:hypothetical protein
VHVLLRPAGFAATNDGRVKVLDFGITGAPVFQATTALAPNWPR